MTKPMAPLLMSRKEAEPYCGISLEGFSVWVRKQILPPAIPGTHRWDRNAVDRRLDELSGTPAKSDLSPLERYKAQLDANND